MEIGKEIGTRSVTTMQRCIVDKLTGGREISTLKREINQVSRHNRDVRDALQQVRNDSSLSPDEVKLAIDGILQMVSLPSVSVS